jgi:hypothetical protein
MRKFDFDSNSTTDQIMGAACMITDPEEAERFLIDYATVIIKASRLKGTIQDYQEGMKAAKSNLAYWAGYYSNEIRTQIEQVFDCEHPIFGKISQLGPPTSQEAFQCGVQQVTLKELRAQKS